jgi:hypothetical protein
MVRLKNSVVVVLMHGVGSSWCCVEAVGVVVPRAMGMKWWVCARSM